MRIVAMLALVLLTSLSVVFLAAQALTPLARIFP